MNEISNLHNVLCSGRVRTSALKNSHMRVAVFVCTATFEPEVRTTPRENVMLGCVLLCWPTIVGRKRLIQRGLEDV